MHIEPEGLAVGTVLPVFKHFVLFAFIFPCNPECQVNINLV